MDPKLTNTGAVGNDFNMSGDNVAGRDINNYYSNEDDNTIRCPYCNTEPESIPDSGEINCSNCNELYYEWRPTANSVSHFKNVPSEFSHKYGDLIFQITASVRLGEFKVAQEKCREAIEISSRTPQAWEYLAYCYYLNTKKEEIIKDKADKLIKYLKIAEEADSNSPTLEKIKQTIAHKLYHVLRHRVNFHRNSDNSEKNKKEWISYYINSWQICYKIFPASFFLKEIINYFYGGKNENWYDYEYREDEGEFQLVHRINSMNSPYKEIGILVNKIRKNQTNYQLPSIKGGDFHGLLKLEINELLEQRKLEKKLKDEEKRVERERKETEKIKAERIKKREQIFSIIGIIIAIPIGGLVIYNYWEWVLGIAVLGVLGVLGSSGSD